MPNSMLLVVLLDEHEWFGLVTIHSEVFSLVVQLLGVFKQLVLCNWRDILVLLLVEHLSQLALLARALIRLPARLLVVGVDVLNALFSQLLRLLRLMVGCSLDQLLPFLSVRPLTLKFGTRLKFVTDPQGDGAVIGVRRHT